VEPLARGGAHVVVVTGSTDRSRWGRAVLHGARTVLSKRGPLQDITATVRRIHLGLPVLLPDERTELVAEWHRHRDELAGARRRLESLSARESQILAHLMKGRAVREIAGLSVVSEATVRTQVKAILAKLQVSSQLAAVGVAHEAGWQAPA
jgi:two-component system, NarL family, nitrate/nitrite response regulator NarL